MCPTTQKKTKSKPEPLAKGTTSPGGPTAGQGSDERTREARPDRGAKGYADIKSNPGTQGHAAQDPTEHGPHKSAYSDSSGPPRFHVPTFSPDARYHCRV